MKKQFMAMGLTALLITNAFGTSLAEATTNKHTVKSNDTLYNIAKTYEVTVGELVSWNGLKNNVIRVGQELVIEETPKISTPSSSVPLAKIIQKQVNVKSTLNIRSKANANASVVGTLRNKAIVDVVSESGKWAKIKFGNKTGFVHTDYLKAVAVSEPIKETKPTTSNQSNYTVKKGDTLSKIARTYSVTVKQLQTWNGLKTDAIHIGQKLAVKKATNEVTPTPTAPASKKVKDETPPKATSKPIYPKDGVKGIYVTEYNIANSKKFDELLGLLQRTELNTMVINVKNDDGRITYDSASEAVNAYKADTNVLKNTKTLMDTLEKKKVYSVARIVTFKDPYMAQKNKDWAMKKKNGDLFYLDGAYWIDPYNQEYWMYVVNVAKEAASLGFDEIQFDYVRFPSNRNNQVDGVVKFNNPGNKSKETIIADFLTYAKKELEPYGVKVSADVFAWAMAVTDDAGIGQKWESITQVVDITSPMIYPSHYSAGNFGVKDPIRQPYDITYASIDRALKREAVLVKDKKQVAGMRPWFQDFSQHGVTYDAKKVKAQLQAAEKLGVKEYLMWNAQNNYTENAYKK